ncbi:hypothetical protein [Candidatus Magnetaquiglobus chichijimensis]|uniref:hypothetical protein n=1 Tax=Candidatus Magnetaquiglobus chichijimensis TaxID=3141448 RepID=UPI003B970E27
MSIASHMTMAPTDQRAATVKKMRNPWTKSIRSQPKADERGKSFKGHSPFQGKFFQGGDPEADPIHALIKNRDRHGKTEDRRSHGQNRRGVNDPATVTWTIFSTE